MNMKVIFLAYRQWSLNVFPAIVKHPKVSECVLCKTHEEYIAPNSTVILTVRPFNCKLLMVLHVPNIVSLVSHTTRVLLVHIHTTGCIPMK